MYIYFKKVYTERCIWLSGEIGEYRRFLLSKMLHQDTALLPSSYLFHRGKNTHVFNIPEALNRLPLSCQIIVIQWLTMTSATNDADINHFNQSKSPQECHDMARNQSRHFLCAFFCSKESLLCICCCSMSLPGCRTFLVQVYHPKRFSEIHWSSWWGTTLS